MVALVGLTAVVVILATDDEISTSGSSTDALSGLSPQERIRVEALSSLSPAQLGAAFGNGTAVDSGTRYDGGPEEGTRGINLAPQASASSGVEAKHEAATAAAIGHPGSGSATETKDEAATAAAIGQSNDGTATHGSKTDPHGPASLLR
jgi:hypothetical protein